MQLVGTEKIFQTKHYKQYKNDQYRAYRTFLAFRGFIKFVLHFFFFVDMHGLIMFDFGSVHI